MSSMPFLEGGQGPLGTSAGLGRATPLPSTLSSAEPVPHQPLFKGLKIKVSWPAPCWGSEGQCQPRADGLLAGSGGLTQLSHQYGGGAVLLIVAVKGGVGDLPSPSP